MTGHGSDVKHFLANTVCDGTNQIDQDISPPMTFIIDEMTDTSDQYHPRPMTAMTEEYDGALDEDDRHVTVLGQKILVKDLKNEMTHLTNLSLRHCKNNQKATLNHKTKLWKEGRLDAWWIGKDVLIDPNDEESFNEHMRYEMERFRAPILLAAMIDLVERYAKFKIRFLFHISGEIEAMRFFKQRLCHLENISPTMRTHPEFQDLFKGKTSIHELLGKTQLCWLVGAPIANGITRTNDLVFEGEPDTLDESAFGAYIKNMAVHTFHHHLIVMRQDKYQVNKREKLRKYHNN